MKIRDVLKINTSRSVKYLFVAKEDSLPLFSYLHKILNNNTALIESVFSIKLPYLEKIPF
jgi:hypothetical protein